MKYNIIKTVGRLIVKHVWFITKKGTAVYIKFDVFRIIKVSINWWNINRSECTEFIQSVKSTKRGRIYIYDTDGNDLSEIYGFYGWNLARNQWSYFKLVEPREMLEDGSDLVRYTVINDSWQLYIGKKRIK